MKTTHGLKPDPKAMVHGEGRAVRGLLGLVLLSLTAACGASAGQPDPNVDFAGARAALRGENGMTTNGLTTNGLTTNGLTTNGLTTDGLTTNGLLAPSFASWFRSNAAAYSNMVMKYVVACALPSGSSRAWTDSEAGVTYTWNGHFGLAPGWAAGNPITEPEQQLITACLAAHVNKYGASVLISMLGVDAAGTPIPYNYNELYTYSEREAAFFGNLFNGAGVFACTDRKLNAHESTIRACALSAQSSGTSSECSPIVIVGNCTSVCTTPRSGPYWTHCTHEGVTYLPITTRLAPSDIYLCGDGVCQPTESCGNSSRYNSCQSDCGLCP